MIPSDSSWLVPLPVLIPLFSAGLALVLARRPRLQQAVAVLAMTAATAVGIYLVFAANSGPVVLDVGSWAAPIGITLVADRLSALMLAVSQVVSLAVLLYSVAQNVSDEVPSAPVSVFYPTFLVLSAGVSNAFLTGDLFNLYVGFEILLAASFVLITLGGTRGRIQAGTIYVVVSLASSGIFLTAIAWIYGAAGTVNMAQLAVRLQELDPTTTLIMQTMLLIAFGVKAAIFPLSAWLPDSYPTAPAPVTAVFAGLLTKVGVYAIIRLQFVLFPGDRLNMLLAIVAILTMIIGILGAVAQDDAKRLLSFTLVSHIGFMMWGISLGTIVGLAAAIYYAVHHIIVQTALFLIVGLIERRTGTTSLTRLFALAKYTPVIAIMFIISALNLVGFPPLTGFIGKLGLAQASAVAGTPIAWTLLAAGILTSFLTLYVAIKFWNKAFWQPQKAGHEDFLLPLGSEPLSGRQERRRNVFRQRAQSERKAERLAEDSRTEVEKGGGQSNFLMYGTVAGLVFVQILIAVYSGPIYGYTTLAARTLMTPGAYSSAVLGEGGRGAGSSADVALPPIKPPWKTESNRPPLLPDEPQLPKVGGEE